MIRYIGNYLDWIKPEWLEEVLNAKGFDMPKHSLRNEARFNPLLKKHIPNLDYIHTKQDWQNIINELESLNQDDPVVKHALLHVEYLNPDRDMGDEYDMYANAGYDVFGTYFTLLEKFDVSFDILDDPPPFLDTKDKHITWWFSKMSPGQVMPMHVDRAKPEIEIHKYWMPWTDYEPGHIFSIGQTVLTNYKAGDVYEFNYAGEWHGACNIGHSSRTILQITDYKPSRNINAIG